PGPVTTFLSKDSEPTPIPVVSVKYKNFFVSSSYYPETEFEFEDSSEIPDLLTIQTSAEREEWDVALGYFLTPYLAFTAGYKDIEQTFVDTITFIGEPPIVTEPSTTDISGPTLGLVGSAPIGSGFGVYGSFAYGFLESEFEGISEDFDTPYVVAEGGVTYTHNITHVPAYMPLSAATVFAGYRFQSYDTEDVTTSGEDGVDEAKGFVVGVNLTF
ncbi:MAG: hypothetical protein MN733_27590, partial [Nitrososphaera sp.]|nr:hypothetical protein [Nitrososphaera sp.]